jgi:hypothetical protein
MTEAEVFNVYGDDQIWPQLFYGRDYENAEQWILLFEQYSEDRQLNPMQKMAMANYLFRETARDWLEHLPDRIYTHWDLFVDGVITNFPNQDAIGIPETENHLQQQTATLTVGDNDITDNDVIRINVAEGNNISQDKQRKPWHW